MMQAGQDWRGDNGSRSLDGSSWWRVLRQRVYASHCNRANTKTGSAQMPFAINQDVIQALALERADQELGIWILPGRAWRHRTAPIPIARGRRVKACP